MIVIDSFSSQKKVTKLEYCQTTLRQLERLGMPCDTHNFQLQAIIGYFKLLDGDTDKLLFVWRRGAENWAEMYLRRSL